MKHVVMFSGGVGSWATARRVARAHGTQGLVLLTADTNTEAPDWMPFVESAAANVGGELVILDNDGRDIWDVFREVRFIGNSRVDPCSRVLKREPLRRWLEDNCDPASTVVHLGFDWSESHRFDRSIPHWSPWKVEAPMCEPPYLDRHEMLAELDTEGIRRPALYDAGFSHNNCAGACVKAGQAQWALLLKKDPSTYRRHELAEQETQVAIGTTSTILRHRTKRLDGQPLSLREFRERLESTPTLFDPDDWGSCSCVG